MKSTLKAKLMVLATIILLLGTASSFAQTTAEEWNEKGNEYFKVENYSQAVKCYSEAAEKGLAKAQFNLGLCYALGNGVEQNDNASVKWFRKAAEQGFEKAKETLDGLGEEY